MPTLVLVSSHAHSSAGMGDNSQNVSASNLFIALPTELTNL